MMNEKELLSIIDLLEQTVRDKNVQEIIAILGKLNETPIYSDTHKEAYDRFGELQQDLVVVLFESLEITEFCEQFKDSKKIYPSDIWEALEKKAERLSFKTLWVMKDYYGFPSSFYTPKLYAVLADEPDEKISEELIETIERLAPRESEKGTVFSEHQTLMSAFRYIRWAPDDGGLSDYVRLLGSRNDAVARDMCKRYLTELPWGTDRGATTVLLEGMSDRRAVENAASFRHALSVHREPQMLRLWLWQALACADPTEALLGAIDDLGRLKQSSDLLLAIDFIGNLLRNLRHSEKKFDQSRVVIAAENVNTKSWSFIVRGYYGTMLRIVLPEANYRKVSDVFGRGFVAIARLGDVIQLDHMGCLFPLLIMTGITIFFISGMGQVEKTKRICVLLLFCGWIGWAIINVRTHFSGQKTLVQKFIYVVVYFTLLFSAIVLSFVCRT